MMTLQSEYERALKSSEEQGHGEDSWQFQDESKIYAIQSYLGSCGEFTDEDWEFARKKGIEYECRYELDHLND